MYHILYNLRVILYFIKNVKYRTSQILNRKINNRFILSFIIFICPHIAWIIYEILKFKIRNYVLNY